MPRFTIAQVGNKELEIKKVNDMKKSMHKLVVPNCYNFVGSNA
jgi:hypothetical protein